MKSSIFVLTHKKFDVPDDDLYVPLLNGSVSHSDDFGYLRDDTGDNISELNNHYAELTGEYWAWKNSEVDIIGFCHYRRYLTKNISFKMLNKADIEEILSNNDIILPNKIHLGITNIEDAKRSHEYNKIGPRPEEYYKLREIIEKDYPDYLTSFDEMLNDKTCYWFNMFICRRELADNYFEWLFDILKKMDEKIDYSSYADNQQRILGYLSERLLNVYIKKHNLKVKDKPFLVTDSKLPLLYFIGYKLPILVILFKYISKLMNR